MFQIMSRDKSFAVICTTMDEKISWMLSITEVLSKLNKDQTSDVAAGTGQGWGWGLGLGLRGQG